jgi:hypothetical protein
VVDEVVVDGDSWANPAVAGTRIAVTSAPATSARRNCMPVYRRGVRDC